jgi:hypothetical protein
MKQRNRKDKNRPDLRTQGSKANRAPPTPAKECFISRMKKTDTAADKRRV